MSHEQFKRALTEVLIRDCEQAIPQTELHIFSADFERNMQALIRRREKPYYRLISTAGRRAACAACFLLMLSAFSVMRVDALRNAFRSFTVSLQSVFSTVTPAETEQGESAIGTVYRITEPMRGCTEKLVLDSPQVRQTLYVRDETTVYFDQYTKEAFHLAVNTEQAQLIPLDIHGNEAIFFRDNLDAYHIIWEEDGYVFYLAGNVNKNQIIRIAESVQKADS